jgi:hypothetical protein
VIHEEINLTKFLVEMVANIVYGREIQEYVSIFEMTSNSTFMTYLTEICIGII